MAKKSLKIFKTIFFILLVLTIGLSAGYFIRSKHEPRLKQIQENKNLYAQFVSEIYEQIQENYWEKIDDEVLSDLYLKAIEKASGKSQALENKNKEEVAKLIISLTQNMDNDKKKEFVTQVVDIVLANLKPFGRSRLYTQKKEKELSDTVQNIDPGTNLYDALELNKSATQEEIKLSYQAIEKELLPKSKESTKAAQQLTQAKRAHKTLSDEENRQLYDLRGVEPTINYQKIGDKIFHIHLTKFSPTTLEELQRVAKKADQYKELDTLILDFRNNIGGAIDNLPYFLGPFIGQDQYAYQFFHQGDKEDFKTKSGWMPELVKYKKVVILINENAQSSAEVMASVLKKYNVGVVVGRTTRGWGTIERVFPLKTQFDETEKYSMFLVHRITLRDDSQPIEGNGVEPLISVDNPSWKKELNKHFNFPELTQAVNNIFFGNN